MIEQELLDRAAWRISSFSGATNGGGGNCVEVAELANGQIAVRNSNHRDAGTVYFTRTEIAAFLAGVKNAEFDDLG